MEELTQKILLTFDQLGKETLDLHELFESGGNDPQARLRVVDLVEQLIDDGLLEETGNDFYSLTDQGKIVLEGLKKKGFE